MPFRSAAVAASVSVKAAAARANRDCSMGAPKPPPWSSQWMSLTPRRTARRHTMSEAVTQIGEPLKHVNEAPLESGMRSLRVLARLLDYPTEALQGAAGELIEAIDAERRLGGALRNDLMRWCQRIADGD